MRQRTGAELWRQKALLHRSLSGIALTDNAAVVADFQGYVHWLDKATGELAGRTRVGKTRVSNTPIVLGGLVIVIDDAGKISAFRATPIKGASHGKRQQSAAPTGDSAPPTPPAPAEPAPSPPVNPQ
jgi:outer membrane protein assembly factor BamB